MTSITKRDGTCQEFDSAHIDRTIYRALCDIMPDSPLNTELAHLYTNEVIRAVGQKDVLTTAELSDIVMYVLDVLHPDLSSAYRIYRKAKDDGLSRRKTRVSQEQGNADQNKAGAGAEEPH